MEYNGSQLSYVNNYNTSILSNYSKEWTINCSKLIGYEKTQCMSFYNLTFPIVLMSLYLNILFYDLNGNFMTIESVGIER